MTVEQLAEKWVDEWGICCRAENMNANQFAKQAYIAGYNEAQNTITQCNRSALSGVKWHKRLERPKGKINALCFDIEQNKFILGFYDLEADEWLRYGGYETINIDLWTKIEIPKYTEKI